MKSVRAALARIAGTFTKDGSDAELREELESHLAMEIAEYVRRGMTPEAARRKALLASGGLTQGAEANAGAARPSVGRERRGGHHVRLPRVARVRHRRAGAF